MNIEILTAYIRAGRIAATMILSDEEMLDALPLHVVEVLKLLRGRACPPDTATEILASVQKAISAQQAVAQELMKTTSSMTPAREAAEKRKICLQSMRDALTALAAESEQVLDWMAAKEQNWALR